MRTRFFTRRLATWIRVLRLPFALLFGVALLAFGGFPLLPPVQPVVAAVSDGSTATSPSNGAYFYAFTDGNMYMYAIDQHFALVQHISSLPTTTGIRGVAADPQGHALYLSYGGDGGPSGNGSLLRYDLLTNTIVWAATYTHGIDSIAITPDGSRIYLPDGEQSTDGQWYIVDSANGQELGSINTSVGTGDCGPHNTVVSLDGANAYMGDRNLNCSGSNYFYVASTLTNKITRKVGPFQSSIRPFTINRAQSLVYTTVTNFLGFQVGDLTSGSVLYTVPVKGFANKCSGTCPSAPSHGISLAPTETELYLIDFPNNYVHVFDVSHTPGTAPAQIANIPVHPFNPQQQPCAYDCLGDGWLLHSLSGQYVFVGDSGDIIDTTTRAVVANLAPLQNTRVFIEIDWQGGQPSATTTRHGLGRKTSSSATPTASPTASPTPSRRATRTPTPNYSASSSPSVSFSRVSRNASSSNGW